MKKFLLPLGALWIAAAASAQTLVNDSFEAGVVASNTIEAATADNLPGWSFSSNVLVYNGTVADLPATIAGSQAVILNSSGPGAWIEQTFETEVGKYYGINVWWGREDYEYAFTNATFLTVLIDGTQLDQFFTRSQDAGGLGFASDYFEFYAANPFTTVRFQSINNPDERSPIIDAITITEVSPAVIPEPSTVALLSGMAALGIVVAVRRRSRK